MQLRKISLKEAYLYRDNISCLCKYNENFFVSEIISDTTVDYLYVDDTKRKTTIPINKLDELYLILENKC